MKKRVLNLSILCLMSSSFNTFASDLSTSFVENPESVIDKAIFVSAAGIADIVAESGSSTNELVSGVIDMLPDVEKALAKTNEGKVANFGNYFGSFLSKAPKYAKEYMCAALEKSANAKDAVLAAAQNNPKIAAALGFCALSGVAYTGYKLIRNAGAKGVGKTLDEGVRTIGGGAAAEAIHSEIDPVLKAQIDAEIEAQGGDVNKLTPWGSEERTILMKYSEADAANLDAIKYLTEIKKANLAIKNSNNRTVHNYAAFWGKPEILEYLLKNTDFESLDLENIIKDTEFAKNHGVFDERVYSKILSLLKLN